MVCNLKKQLIFIHTQRDVNGCFTPNIPFGILCIIMYKLFIKRLSLTIQPCTTQLSRVVNIRGHYTNLYNPIRPSKAG